MSARQTQSGGAPRPLPRAPGASDEDARQLLRVGLWILAAGLLAALLTKFVFGGIGIHGPHTNSGWLSLIAALASLPFGLMLATLGAAKWLRHRHHRRMVRRDR